VTEIVTLAPPRLTAALTPPAILKRKNPSLDNRRRCANALPIVAGTTICPQASLASWHLLFIFDEKSPSCWRIKF
jgi:hypothetical protein